MLIEFMDFMRYNDMENNNGLYNDIFENKNIYTLFFSYKLSRNVDNKKFHIRYYQIYPKNKQT